MPATKQGPVDLEFAALQAVYDTLARLDVEAQRRVLDWVTARLMADRDQGRPVQRDGAPAAASSGIAFPPVPFDATALGLLLKTRTGIVVLDTDGALAPLAEVVSDE